MRYVSADWSLEMPNGWEFEEDDTCTTFTNPQGVGAFQISSYRKDEAVTDNDLQEFAENSELMKVSLAKFTGLHAQFDENETFWKKWWLRNERQMIYATYNCPLSERGREDSAVDTMLDSLSPEHDCKKS